MLVNNKSEVKEIIKQNIEDEVGGEVEQYEIKLGNLKGIIKNTATGEKYQFQVIFNPSVNSSKDSYNLVDYGKQADKFNIPKEWGFDNSVIKS